MEMKQGGTLDVESFLGLHMIHYDGCCGCYKFYFVRTLKIVP